MIIVRMIMFFSKLPVFRNSSVSSFQRTLLAALLAALCALGTSGCGKRESAVSQATRDGIFLFDNGTEPRDLDPHLVTGLPEHRIIKSILEGLVAEHPSDSNQVVPGVAESWEHNDDASIWTFHLRENAKWSNGDPVTAGDFQYAYQRMLNPELGAPYAEMLSVIKGATPYNRGELTDWNEVGVKAVDAHTLRLELVGPTAYFPLMLTHYSFFPVHRPTIEKFDAFARRASGWTRAGNFVGNGPFVLTEWLPNQRIVVEKSPTYWDAGAIKLKAVHFFPFQDRQMGMRAYLAGQLHKTDGVPFNQRDQMREQRPEEMREDPFFATSYMGINVRRKALQDSRVRRALAMAIDFNRITTQVTKNGRAADGFVPPGVADYPYQDYFDYDPAAARELLAEAGHPGGEGLPVLSFITVASDTSKTFAEVVQNMWREELGVEIQIENKEWQVLLADMDEGNFDFFLLSWIGDYVDPAAFLKIMKTGSGNNHSGYADPAYDALLDEAARTADVKERLQLLGQAEARLMDAMPIIPATWNRLLYLLHPDVHGWPTQKLLDDFSYKSLSLEAAE
jgi:oligopeptide transport system substrate-binding protein